MTRIYDAELRATGLRVTQFTLLSLLSRSGEVRQGDLGEMASLAETTLTRSLRLLQKSGWVTIRAGADRREKLVAITEAGKEKVEQARPAWSRAQERFAPPFQTGHGIHFSRRCRTSRKPLRKRHRGEIRWQRKSGVVSGKSGVGNPVSVHHSRKSGVGSSFWKSGVEGNPVSVHHSCPWSNRSVPSRP